MQAQYRTEKNELGSDIYISNIHFVSFLFICSFHERDKYFNKTPSAYLLFSYYFGIELDTLQ